MKNHQDLNPLLPFYLAGTLDEKQTAAVKAHLEVCPVCREDLTLWREVEETVHVETESVRAPQQVLTNAFKEISSTKGKLNPLEYALRVTRAQIPMVVREIWPTSLLVLLLGFVITLLSDRAGFLFAFAPLVSVAGLAFIYNKSYDPAFELVLSTPVSQIQLLLARSGLVFGFNMLVVSLLGLGLLLHFSMDVISPLLKGWLAPMTFLSTLGLFLSIFLKPGNAISITYALWLSQFLPLTEEIQQFSGRLSEYILWFWQTPTLLFLISLFLLVFMTFSVMRGFRFTRHLA